MQKSIIKYPKIGIRPVIDGRMGGVRESLETQTMNMARSAAKLISDNLKYPDGSKVSCIISDTTIGGVREASMADEKFELNGVGVTLTVTPCWCYGSETMDMSPTRIKAIWGFNGTERPGAVYLAAALAATIMRNRSYLSIGNVSMGIAGSIVNPDFFEDYLGMRVEYVDMTEIKRRIDLKVYDEEEYLKALSWVKENLKEGPDDNPADNRKSRKDLDADWEFSVKMALICRDLMIGNEKLKSAGYYEESLGHNAIAAGFQGQRQWTDYYPNGDFVETILNSSFDWNGTRNPYILATENDSMNGISMLFGYLLTNTAQIFSDVRTYWSPDAVERITGYKLEGVAQNGIIHLINSGSTALDGTGQQEIGGKPAIKPYWEITKDEIKKCIDATLFRPAAFEYFRGGGFSTDFTTRAGMPVTMSRMNLVKGLGPVLQIAEGETIKLPDKIHDLLDKRTNPTWPTTWFVPRLTGRGAFRDVYSVMNNWGANHGAVSYGHIGARLITLASILRIPVCMHNVDDNKIFRPSSWNAFGLDNKESADYRACRNFGPQYKKV